MGTTVRTTGVDNQKHNLNVSTIACRLESIISDKDLIIMSRSRMLQYTRDSAHVFIPEDFYQVVVKMLCQEEYPQIHDLAECPLRFVQH